MNREWGRVEICQSWCVSSQQAEELGIVSDSNSSNSFSGEKKDKNIMFC